MDMDKIIEKMKNNRDDRIKEVWFCTRGLYNERDMRVFADGYCRAVKDLTDLVERQSPPCTGSSVQSNKVDSEKLYDFCETLKEYSKAVKNKPLDFCFTYDINIGDDVKLKDGTIGKINYAGRLHKHDEYEWYFVIAIEKGKTICMYSYDLSKDFQQIGRYKFYSECKKAQINKLQPSITKESVPSSRVEFKANGEMLFIADLMEDVYKKSPPTNEQLMDKINEIIDVINGKL